MKGVCLSACWDIPPLVWAWRPPPGSGPGDPPGSGPGDPPGQTPQLPCWVSAWRPPSIPTRHVGIPPAMHNACWDTTPSPPWTAFLTHASENITLPQTLFAGGNKNLINKITLRTINKSCIRLYSHIPFSARFSLHFKMG